MIRLSGSVNRDRFLRFGWFLFVSAFPVNFGQYTGMKLWSDLEEMKEQRRRTKIIRKSNNFRSWTKGFVRGKKKSSREEEDKFLKKQKNKKTKKRRKKKNTTKQGLRPVKAAAGRLLTQSPITPSSSAVASSSFFFYFSSSLSFFRWWRSIYNSSFSLNTTAISAMCSLSFLCYFVTPFEFWIPKSLTWLASIGMMKGFKFLIKAKNFNR